MPRLKLLWLSPTDEPRSLKDSRGDVGYDDGESRPLILYHIWAKVLR